MGIIASENNDLSELMAQADNILIADNGFAKIIILNEMENFK